MASMGRGALLLTICCLHCPLCKGQRAAALAGSDGLGAPGLQHLLDEAKCPCWRRDSVATLPDFSSCAQQGCAGTSLCQETYPTTTQLGMLSGGKPQPPGLQAWPSVLTTFIYLTSTALRDLLFSVITSADSPGEMSFTIAGSTSCRWSSSAPPSDSRAFSAPLTCMQTCAAPHSGPSGLDKPQVGAQAVGIDQIEALLLLKTAERQGLSEQATLDAPLTCVQMPAIQHSGPHALTDPGLVQRQ